MIFLSAPKSAVVREIQKKYVADNPDVPSTLIEWQGVNLSFVLPDSYEERRHEIFDRPTGTVLEQVFFTQLSDSGRKIALTIERAEGGQVENTSSYLFRLGNPKIYTKQNYDWDEKHHTLFLKNDAVYEILGYQTKDGVVASFVLSSVAETPEKLMPDFLKIWKSMQWGGLELSKNK